MRRDYFTLELANLDGPATPTVAIDYEGPSDGLTGRLKGPDGEPLDAEELDIAYRLQGDLDESDASGVLAITNRVTGEFVLELNAEAKRIVSFVRAARDQEGDGDRYRLQVTVDGEPVVDHQKGMFLVYDADGGLLRQHSLIPSGVEL
jgi:hypothetical protein